MMATSESEVDNSGKEYTKIDGLITNMRGITLTTREADCTPILLYDPVKNVIGNIHSGWRGTIAKISKNAIKKMIEEYECNVKDIICCIGPCIRECHFVVRDDVKEQFEKAFYNRDIIRSKKDESNQYYIDTVLAIKEMFINELGILQRNIEDCEICTVCNSSILHSYRVKKEESGRNVAIIGLKF